MQRLLDADPAVDMIARENSGFSVDASVCITLIDRTSRVILRASITCCDTMAGLPSRWNGSP